MQSNQSPSYMLYRTNNTKQGCQLDQIQAQFNEGHYKQSPDCKSNSSEIEITHNYKPQ